MIRFTRERPCPVCGGWDQQERGQQRRCWGYLSDDGKYAHCTRPEHAGTLTQNADSTWSHYLPRACRCGVPHETATATDTGTEAKKPRATIVATYDYRDADRVLRYQVVRYRPKAFKQRRPGPDGKWVWSLKGVDRLLYRLPELNAADPDACVFVVEGEKDADRLATLGLVATCNSEGAGKWPQSGTAALAGRRVVILPDQDDAGRDGAARVRAALIPVATEVRTVNLDAKDVSDWLDAGHTVEQLLELVEAAGPPAPDDGATLLEEVAGYYRRFLVMPSEAALDALTLWTVHTHTIDAADTTAYLRVQSPEKGSGKTRVIEVAEPIVADPVQSLNATVAAIFRRIDQGRITLLFDETDTVFNAKKNGDSEDLRGLFNGGYRRGAKVLRTVGEGSGMECREFSAFCAKMLVGLHDLPDTLQDRAIVIRMKRRRRDEPVARFRRRRIEAETAALRERLKVWADAHLRELREADPAIPDFLGDRAADCWEPLLAIADLAEGWPARAREAARILSAASVEDENWGVLLLSDVRDAFYPPLPEDEEEPIPDPLDELATVRLVERLRALEEHPWGDLDGRGKKLDARFLARKLGSFDVKPKNLRLDGKVVKGYARSDFEDAWARYLPPGRRFCRYAATGEDRSGVADKCPSGGKVGGESSSEDLRDGPLEEESSEPERTSPDVTPGSTADWLPTVERLPAGLVRCSCCGWHYTSDRDSCTRCGAPAAGGPEEEEEPPDELGDAYDRAMQEEEP